MHCECLANLCGAHKERVHGMTLCILAGTDYILNWNLGCSGIFLEYRRGSTSQLGLLD